MSRRTVQQLIRYGTPLIVAAYRLGWTVNPAYEHRSTARYIRAILEWCALLGALWLLHAVAIFMAAFVVAHFGRKLGWVPPAPGVPGGVTAEVRGLVTLTCLLITLGAWVADVLPPPSADDDDQDW